MKLFYAVFACIYFFLMMGFAYEAFEATENVRMGLFAFLSIYFAVRGTQLVQEFRSTPSEN